MTACMVVTREARKAEAKAAADRPKRTIHGAAVPTAATRRQKNTPAADRIAELIEFAKLWGGV